MDLWEVLYLFFGDDLGEIIKIVAFVTVFVILSGVQTNTAENKRSVSDGARVPASGISEVWRRLEKIGREMAETRPMNLTAENGAVVEGVEGAVTPKDSHEKDSHGIVKMTVMPQTKINEPAKTNIKSSEIPKPPATPAPLPAEPLITPEAALSAIAWAEILQRPRLRRR